MNTGTGTGVVFNVVARQNHFGYVSHDAGIVTADIVVDKTVPIGFDQLDADRIRSDQVSDNVAFRRVFRNAVVVLVRRSNARLGECRLISLSADGRSQLGNPG